MHFGGGYCNYWLYAIKALLWPGLCGHVTFSFFSDYFLDFSKCVNNKATKALAIYYCEIWAPLSITLIITLSGQEKQMKNKVLTLSHKANENLRTYALPSWLPSLTQPTFCTRANPRAGSEAAKHQDLARVFLSIHDMETFWAATEPRPGPSPACGRNKRAKSAVMPSLSTLILQLVQHRFSIKEKHYIEIPRESRHRGQFGIYSVTDQRTLDAHLSDAIFRKGCDEMCLGPFFLT